MIDIVNKFLLPGNNLMPKMHFKQPRFTFSNCGPFTKNLCKNLYKQEIQVKFTGMT